MTAENDNLLESLYVLYNTKTKSLYRAQTWAGGRFSTELKTWKTLNGATKALEKLQKPGVECPLQIKLLSVKDING